MIMYLLKYMNDINSIKLNSYHLNTNLQNTSKHTILLSA